MKIILTILTLLILFSCEKKTSDKFVQVNGTKQHVLDLGEGNPTVIFIAGLGNGLEVFETVQNQIAKITRTVSYDRAGLGKSESIDTVRTIDRMANELNELVSEMGIDEPFVLVAHSIGGYIARYYLHQYPDKVCGMVLIDPTDETFYENLFNRLSPIERARQDSLIYSVPPNLPVPIRNEIMYNRHSDSLMRTIDFKSKIPISLLVAVKLNEIDRSYGMTDEYMKMKVECFEKLKTKIPQIKIKVTDKSGHYIQLDEPNLVAETIEQVLKEVKTNWRQQK